MQNGKVQDLKTLDSGFEVKAYSRFRDKNGRVLIVVGGEREWDEKRQVSKGWHTITLFNLSTGRKEEPIIYDRFVHYIAKGSLTRHLPKANPQPRF